MDAETTTLPKGEHAAPTLSSSGPSTPLMIMAGFAIGALVANLYYTQPLLSEIAPEIGISRDLAGSIVSATQIGYGVGLFLLVSLADLVENKKLVLLTLTVLALALVGVAIATTAPVLFVCAFIVGVCSTGAQVLVPFMAHLAPPERRGRVTGKIMAGLLTGVMLSRPVALFISDALGWRAVFWVAAGLMVAIGLALWRMMPEYQPRGGLHYGQIVMSMFKLLRESAVLRRRAAYQGLLYGAFSMFWTAAPMMLADRFGMSQKAIALFALAGAGSALAAPITGRLADRGQIRLTTAGMIALAGVTFFATDWVVDALLLAPLVVLTIVFDASVQAHHVLTQRIIFSGAAEMRGRVNAVYMTSIFFCGAVGAVAGTVTYRAGGWHLTALCGGLVGVILLLFFVTELGRPQVTRIADM